MAVSSVVRMRTASHKRYSKRHTVRCSENTLIFGIYNKNVFFEHINLLPHFCKIAIKHFAVSYSLRRHTKIASETINYSWLFWSIHGHPPSHGLVNCCMRKFIKTKGKWTLKSIKFANFASGMPGGMLTTINKDMVRRRPKIIRVGPCPSLWHSTFAELYACF